MTKNEIQAQYMTLAAKVGDLYFRRQATAAALKAMDDQMSTFLKERNALEEQMKTASDESPPDAMENTPS